MLFYQPAGPLWALFLLTPLVPLLDVFFKGAMHQWRPNESPATSSKPSRPSVKIFA
jgi:hypothetical protein